jgi:hypothetical protein
VSAGWPRAYAVATFTIHIRCTPHGTVARLAANSNTLAQRSADLQTSTWNGANAAGEGESQVPSPPLYILNSKKNQSEAFFATTLAIVSVYAAWGAWYAGQNWNSIAFGVEAVTSTMNSVKRGGGSRSRAALSPMTKDQAIHRIQAAISELRESTVIQGTVGHTSADEAITMLEELKDAIQKPSAGSAPCSKC